MPTSILTDFQIQGMTCAGCVGRVEKAVMRLDGVQRVVVNLATETAQVQFNSNLTNQHQIEQVLQLTGYPGVAITDAKQNLNGKDKTAQTYVNKAIIAAILAIPVVILEMGGHVFPEFHHVIARNIGLQNSWLIQFILTSLILAWPGQEFFTKGINALRRLAPDMNSLVAIGAGAAYLFSVFATLLPHLFPPQSLAVYFESAAIIVVFILLGRWLENRAKGRTGQAIRNLIGLQAKTARIIRGEAAVDVDIETLVVGDIVLVRPGERVPVDGQVISGSSFIDESMITGEPIAIAKTQGDLVTGGTLNGQGAVTCAVTRVGRDTTLAQIIRLVEQAQGAKLPVQNLVDQITMWFVPAILGLAGVTFAAWMIFAPDLGISSAIIAAVSVLIVACPCAMGLAVPTSIMVGTGRAAEMGVLYRKGDALQTLSEVSTAAFDKTGTLTMGQPTVSDVQLCTGFERDTVLTILATVERNSEHPIAQAILRLGQVGDMSATDFKATPGKGVTAQVGSDHVVIGTSKFLGDHGIDTRPFQSSVHTRADLGETVVFAAISGTLAAMVSVADPVKPEAKATLQTLMSSGLDVAMITGDRSDTAQAIGRQLGITKIAADVLPAGKIEALRPLRVGAGKIAFVGDGINDAPALAFADVGIALGTGTDVAIESADVVLMSGDLQGVINAIKMSKVVMRNIRQNLAWAFGYNILLLPVAAGVFYPIFGLTLSPMFAAGAMALSSVFVISNALRLRFLIPRFR